MMRKNLQFGLRFNSSCGESGKMNVKNKKLGFNETDYTSPASSS